MTLSNAELQGVARTVARLHRAEKRVSQLEEENERLINSEERAWLEVQSLRDELVAEKKARER